MFDFSRKTVSIFSYVDFFYLLFLVMSELKSDLNLSILSSCAN